MRVETEDKIGEMGLCSVNPRENNDRTETAEFEEIISTVTADSRGRIVLGSVVKDEMFTIRRNRLGQILLTPVVIISKHELWLWQNPDALSSVQRGLQQVGQPASFAQYADLEIED